MKLSRVSGRPAESSTVCELCGPKLEMQIYEVGEPVG